MTTDSSVQNDYANGISAEAAANAGKMAAQNGQPCAPQQSNESAEAYAQRQAAYAQNQVQQQS